MNSFISAVTRLALIGFLLVGCAAVGLGGPNLTPRYRYILLNNLVLKGISTNGKVLLFVKPDPSSSTGGYLAETYTEGLGYEFVSGSQTSASTAATFRLSGDGRLVYWVDSSDNRVHSFNRLNGATAVSSTTADQISNPSENGGSVVFSRKDTNTYPQQHSLFRFSPSGQTTFLRTITVGFLRGLLSNANASVFDINLRTGSSFLSPDRVFQGDIQNTLAPAPFHSVSESAYVMARASQADTRIVRFTDPAQRGLPKGSKIIAGQSVLASFGELEDMSFDTSDMRMTQNGNMAVGLGQIWRRDQGVKTKDEFFLDYFSPYEVQNNLYGFCKAISGDGSVIVLQHSSGFTLVEHPETFRKKIGESYNISTQIVVRDRLLIERGLDDDSTRDQVELGFALTSPLLNGASQNSGLTPIQKTYGESIFVPSQSTYSWLAAGGPNIPFNAIVVEHDAGTLVPTKLINCSFSISRDELFSQARTLKNPSDPTVSIFISSQYRGPILDPMS